MKKKLIPMTVLIAGVSIIFGTVGITTSTAATPAWNGDIAIPATSNPCTATHPHAPRGGGSKYVIYMTALNIGNNWQNEAENLGLAIAKMKPYSDCIEVRKDLTDASGTDKQISEIQSMVAAGADGIISYALSPTAVNTAYKAACTAGVAVISYDATVTEPCVYNVSYITNVPKGASHPFMGYNAMSTLLGLIGNTGNIFVAHGVAGTSTDNVHYLSAKAAIKTLAPKVKILTEWNGLWSPAQQLKETTKALTAFPKVNGIFCGYGESGCIKALKAIGKKIPVTGETSQYMREQLVKGWPGESLGSPPAQGGIAMKVMAEILLNGPTGVPMDIEVPFRGVTAKTAKVCANNVLGPNCNMFVPGSVDPEFSPDIWNPMSPEATLSASLTGTPAENAVAKPYSPAYLANFAQDPSRRYVTRNVCDTGWKPGNLPENVEGCVKG